MFFACGIWYLADVSSVSPSSEQCESVMVLSFLKASTVLNTAQDSASLRHSRGMIVINMLKL